MFQKYRTLRLNLLSPFNKTTSLPGRSDNLPLLLVYIFCAFLKRWRVKALPNSLPRKYQKHRRSYPFIPPLATIMTFASRMKRTFRKFANKDYYEDDMSSRDRTTGVIASAPILAPSPEAAMTHRTIPFHSSKATLLPPTTTTIPLSSLSAQAPKPYQHRRLVLVQTNHVTPNAPVQFPSNTKRADGSPSSRSRVLGTKTTR